MPKTYVHLRVFISSPGDVQEEREAVREVIDELNALNRHASGVWLEPVGWEDSVYSDFGADPQSVINAQIGDSYDIFVGILWTRIGTATPRATSGTMEEFQRAIEQHKSDQESISIGLYFKDAQVSPSSIDFEQAAAVQRFRHSLKDLGGLYRVFATLDDFKSLLRLQLNGNLQKWSTKVPPSPTSKTKALPAEGSPTTGSIERPLEADEELGLLDYREAFEESVARFQDVLTMMGSALEDHARGMEERTAELNDLNSRGVTVDELKGINNRAAEDLAGLANKMTPLVKEYAAAFDVLVDSLSHLATFPGFEEEPTTKSQNLAAIHDLIAKIVSSQSFISEFTQTISSLPRMTTKLNRAKKSAVQILREFHESTATRLGVLAELETELRRLDEEKRSCSDSAAQQDRS